MTAQKLCSQDFSQLDNSVLSKGKSAIPPLFNGPDVLSSAPDRAKLFTENFSKNSKVDDSGISLPVFPSRTNLKLHISVNPTMVKKLIMNLDLSKSSGPNCIPAGFPTGVQNRRALQNLMGVLKSIHGVAWDGGGLKMLSKIPVKEFI